MEGLFSQVGYVLLFEMGEVLVFMWGVPGVELSPVLVLPITPIMGCAYLGKGDWSVV